MLKSRGTVNTLNTTMIHNKILITALACLLVCPVLSVSAASNRDRRYSTIYAQQYKPTEKYPRNTLQGDFLWAAGSSSLRTAAVHWKNFLVKYGERELDSAIQPQLISIAKYELMRVYFLLGNIRAADQILKELDPLKLLSALPQSRSHVSMNFRLSPRKRLSSI
ncbi:MAG: hypothetical protein H0U18_10825 [Pyrinomonadaceae bacterium]|jgi:hypothetical protein|nr:hypothetical protein [Pyrinomonadaceae bacterium]